jgi:hypothetical protein
MKTIDTRALRALPRDTSGAPVKAPRTRTIVENPDILAGVRVLPPLDEVGSKTVAAGWRNGLPEGPIDLVARVALPVVNYTFDAHAPTRYQVFLDVRVTGQNPGPLSVSVQRPMPYEERDFRFNHANFQTPPTAGRLVGTVDSAGAFRLDVRNLVGLTGRQRTLEGDVLAPRTSATGLEVAGAIRGGNLYVDQYTYAEEQPVSRAPGRAGRIDRMHGIVGEQLETKGAAALRPPFVRPEDDTDPKTVLGTVEADAATLAASLRAGEVAGLALSDSAIRAVLPSPLWTGAYPPRAGMQSSPEVVEATIRLYARGMELAVAAPSALFEDLSRKLGVSAFDRAGRFDDAAAWRALSGGVSQNRRGARVLNRLRSSVKNAAGEVLYAGTAVPFQGTTLAAYLRTERSPSAPPNVTKTIGLDDLAPMARKLGDLAHFGERDNDHFSGMSPSLRARLGFVYSAKSGRMAPTREGFAAADAALEKDGLTRAFPHGVAQLERYDDPRRLDVLARCAELASEQDETKPEHPRAVVRAYLARPIPFAQTGVEWLPRLLRLAQAAQVDPMSIAVQFPGGDMPLVAHPDFPWHMIRP